MSAKRWRRALLPLTIPLSWLYRVGVSMRNARFDRGDADVGKLPVGVVSVGNLTVGGSGKTPLVAALARELLARKLPVAVLSRGYGRRSDAPYVLVSDGRDILADPSEAGDEPIELAENVPGVVVAVGPDRLYVGRRTLQDLGQHVMVLDDGFQHRSLHRDIDLVCIDSSEPASSLRLLPAGRLREPLSSLRRAHALVWTRWHEGAPSDELASRVVAATGGELPTIRAVSRTLGFRRLDAKLERLGPDVFRDAPVGVAVGVAQPERIVEGLDARVVLFAARRDHHVWEAREIGELAKRARDRGAVALLTTSKDAVKMRPFFEARAVSPAVPVYEVRVQAEILDENAWRSLIDRLPGP